MKKNLLIGAIVNYCWEDVAPFFTSYARAGFENCDCVVFTANMSESTIEKIKSCGVNVLPIPESYYKNIRKYIIDYRWELYSAFLRDKYKDYDMIFTADIRDSFFQRDIFKCYDSSKPFLGVTLENGTLTEGVNRNWLTTRYGEAIYNTIKDNAIICMGTVLGTSEEFFKFTEAMAENLTSSKYTYFHVADQATGNFLIYHEKMFADCLLKIDSETGYITTSITESTKFDSENRVLNGKGEIAAVVHQYDRNLEVLEQVVNKFCPDIKGFYYDTMIIKRQGFIYNLARNYYKFRKKGIRITLRALKRKIYRKLTGKNPSLLLD